MASSGIRDNGFCGGNSPVRHAGTFPNGISRDHDVGTPAWDTPAQSGASAELVCYWPRAVIHVAMHAFFASVESRDAPELRGMPLAVTRDEVGTTIISVSPEARLRGVGVGMALGEARGLCPGLIHRPARPKAYAAVSARIVRALAVLSAEVEAAGIDEIAVDVTHRQHHGSPEYLAQLARRLVLEAGGGIPCSLGVAATRLTAKVAAGMNAPNGVTVLAPWDARERLRDTPIEMLCGIAPHVAGFLKRHGAHTCGDVSAMAADQLVRRYGHAGRQLWLACQGRDAEPVSYDPAPPMSMRHGKVLPPRTTSRRVIEAYLRHLCEKVAARLRHNGLSAGKLYVEMRYGLEDGIAQDFPFDFTVPDGRRLLEFARRLLHERWRGEAVTHVQVTASRLRRVGGQLDLFAPPRHRVRAADRNDDR